MPNRRNNTRRNYNEIENQQRDLSRRTVEESIERIDDEIRNENAIIQLQAEEEFNWHRDFITETVNIELNQQENQAEREMIIQEAREDLQMERARIQREAERNIRRERQRIIDKYWEREE